MLALSSVRGRLASFAGTFAAVLVGAALLATTLLVYASATPQVPERLSKADLIVHGPLAESRDWRYVKPWDAASASTLAQRLREVPGVRFATEDREFYAQARKDGPSQGYNWSSLELSEYTLMEGSAPQTAQDVAVSSALGLKPGAVVEVLFAHGPRQMTVTGVVSAPGIYVTDELAAALSPGVKAIGLVTSGADLSNVDLSGGVAAAGIDRAVMEPQDDTSTRWLGVQLLSAMALLGSFVTVFIVASTFALSAAQRRRELGLLRLAGATPWQVRRLILGEAGIVGLVASVTGAALSLALAPGFGRLLVDWGLEPAGFEVALQFWPLAAAVMVGTSVAVIGAWPSSRRAATALPLEALQEAIIEKRAMSWGRWILGGLALATGAGLAVASGSAEAEDRVNFALLTAMALIVAAAMLAPIVIKPLVRLVTAPAKRASGASAMLVRAEMLNATRRSASAAAPVIATVGFAVLLTGMVSTMSEAYPAGKRAELAGISIVVPDGTPGITEQVVQAAGGQSRLPTRVFANGTSYEAAGTADPLTGPELDVTFADGTTHRVRVQFADTPDYDLLLPREVVRAHDPSALSSLIMGATVAGPGAKVVDAATFAEAEYSEDTRLLWLFTMVLVGLSVGYTGISIINTMAMAGAGRRVDLRVLRQAGATVRQVLGMHAAETAITVGIGAMLGLAVTVPALAGMSSGLASEMGVPVDLRLHWATLVGVCGACLALGVAASAASVWRTVSFGRRQR